jgi:hypothetical protein
MLRRRWVPIAAMLLMSVAPAAFAAPGFFRPAAGDRLEPGTVVEVFWDLHGIPSDAQESELVLSLDGGRTFPIRLTADFDPATRKILWRVPALATDQARLALRAGNDEEPAQEFLQLISPAFVISGSGADATLEELFAVGSEWRTREALEIDAGGPRDAGLHGVSSEQIHAGPDRDLTAHSGQRPALLPERLPEAAATAAPRTPQQAIEPAFGQRLLPTPLRE